MPQERPQFENVPQSDPERQRWLELAREFFHKETFQLNGKTFELYGVAHVLETIELHLSGVLDKMSSSQIVKTHQYQTFRFLPIDSATRSGES